jgi:hypothetical protein
MSVRMRVEKYVVGNHDPLVMVGSTPESGIAWGPGDEIVVTAELAEKLERSGIATKVQPVAEVAAFKTPETAVRNTGRKRSRA